MTAQIIDLAEARAVRDPRNLQLADTVLYVADAFGIDPALYCRGDGLDLSKLILACMEWLSVELHQLFGAD